MRFKLKNGIPQALISCHTDDVADYMIERHIPAALTRRLLHELPNVVGLSPEGLPGIGPESERDVCEVFLIQHKGST